MTMRLRYDQDDDVLYVALLEGERVSRTDQLDAGTLVDVDRLGRPLGIEVIRPARNWPLEDVLSRYDVSEEDAQELRLMFGRAGIDRPYPFARPAAVA